MWPESLSFVFIILQPLLGGAQTREWGSRSQKVECECSEGPDVSTGSPCSREGSHSLKALVSSCIYVCALNLKTWKTTPSHLTLKGQCGHPITALADSKLNSLQTFSVKRFNRHFRGCWVRTRIWLWSSGEHYGSRPSTSILLALG